MAEPGQPPVPIQPPAAGPQGPAAGATTPFGQSPMVSPAPNAGYEQAAMQKIAMAMKSLEPVLQMVGAGSEIGREVLKALNVLAKVAPPGSVSPEGQKNEAQNSLMAALKNAAMMAQMKKQGLGGGAPGAGNAGAPPGGAAPPKPPMAA